MGDLNINLLKYNSHNPTNEFINSTLSHGFVPMITKPTRLTHTSATLIDHIYTNCITTKSKSGIILNDVADHFGTFHMMKTYKSPRQPQLSNLRYYTTHNIANFRHLIEQQDFTELHNLNDTDKAYDIFITKIKSAHDRAFPMQVVKIKNTTVRKEPWITPGLIISSHNKIKLHRKKIKNPTPTNISNYKNYLKVFNKLKRQTKKLYYEQLFEANKNDLRRTWNELRKVINKENNKKELPTTIKVNNLEITNKHEIADTFNNFFINIGKQVSETIKTNKDPMQYMPADRPHSMYLTPTDPLNVINVAKLLKPKTSSGYDNISNKLMLEIIDIVAIHFSYIVNLSFSKGIVPIKMKIAKVIPIHKSGNRQDINNFRPISLLPAFSKLLEKLMYTRIIDYIERNEILYKHQYGFRKGHSSIHPIIQFLNKVADVNNKLNPELTMGIYIDLRKAFDTISHNILVNKLNKYGIRGIANKWIQNYLTNRTQFVNYADTKSSTENITCGIPQGSILGPLLFLLYINDIANALTITTYSFADDTTLLISDTDIKSLYARANIQLNLLNEWLGSNKLDLNTVTN